MRLSSDDALQMTFHGYSPRLQHRHFDVFEVPPTQRSGPFDPLADALVQFVSGFDGEVRAVRAHLEPASPAIEFARRAQ